MIYRLFNLSKSVLWSAFVCSFFLNSCVTTEQTDHRATPEFASHRIEKSVTKSEHAMIAVANPHAAQAGLRILKAGGNALDAAIAAQLVLNLVEPQSSGIGGGGFLLIFDPKTKQVTSFDGRETAPNKATGTLFIKPDGQKMGFFEAAVGGRAVGTPGLLAMLSQAHQKYGHLEWADLFNEAISLSENGFEISPRLHSLLEKDRFLKTDPTARSYFYTEKGTAKPIGTLLKNPAFAKTLTDIQQNGISAFYNSALTDQIIHKVHSHPSNPGLLSKTDFSTYTTKERPPVCLEYHIYKVCGMGPPSSGGITLLQILGLMEQYERSHPHPSTINRTHLLAEASKLAFADRNCFLADGDFIPIPIQSLLDSAYLKNRQSLIQNSKSLNTPVVAGNPALFSQRYAPDPFDHGLSTTHMSIVDQNGMVVSMTSSIENAFGSRQMVGGFLLNNQLTDFSFLPEKDGHQIANRVEGGKRPRSSMAPTLVLNKETGKPVLAIGSPGGSRIIGYVAQSLIAVLNDNQPLDQALAQGHITNRNGTTDLEEGTEAENLKDMLETLGHQVTFKPMTSGLHAVQILESGTLIGAADPRREGVAIGY